jgi:hypothetical protein
MARRNASLGGKTHRSKRSDFSVCISEMLPKTRPSQKAKAIDCPAFCEVKTKKIWRWFNCLFSSLLQKTGIVEKPCLDQCRKDGQELPEATRRAFPEEKILSPYRQIFYLLDGTSSLKPFDASAIEYRSK